MKKILSVFTLLLVFGCSNTDLRDSIGLPTEPSSTAPWPVGDTKGLIAPEIFTRFTGRNDDQIVITLLSGEETSDESPDFKGFNFYRSTNTNSWPIVPVNSELIDKDNLFGKGQSTYYFFTDNSGLVTNVDYYYKIEAVDLAGNTTPAVVGPIQPVKVNFPGKISGRVLRKGIPVPNVPVVCTSYNDDFNVFSSLAYTDYMGVYHINDVETGNVTRNGITNVRTYYYFASTKENRMNQRITVPINGDVDNVDFEFGVLQ